MKKFAIKLLVFTGPIIIFLVFPTYVFYYLKENFFRIDGVIRSNEKYLIGYVYNESDYNYLKWAYLNFNEKKKVWTLGSSRVLSFRKEMFDVTFYNTGYTVSSINDFIPFMNGIPKDKHPKYVIIGLDQWMFNASHDNLNTESSIDKWKNSFNFYPQEYSYVSFYRDLFAGKYRTDIFKLTNSFNKIGINAVVNNQGFRNDGSMFYGNQIVKLLNNDFTVNDYGYANTLSRIKNGNNLFEYGNLINDKALLELNELLKYCKENQIEVIAFLPPFADEIYKKMIESGNYGYLMKIYSEIKPIFDKYNYEVYDFSTVSSINSSDSETLDGFHGGELTYQRILIKILDSGSILNQVADVDKLRYDLSNSKNRFIIYNY